MFSSISLLQTGDLRNRNQQCCLTAVSEAFKYPVNPYGLPGINVHLRQTKQCFLHAYMGTITTHTSVR